MLAGYGTSRHAGSKLIKYGLTPFVILPAKRRVKDVLPAPAMPKNYKYIGFYARKLENVGSKS